MSELQILINAVGCWQNYVNEIGDWVLCRLSMKKRSIESDRSVTHHKHRQQNIVQTGPRLFDFMMVGKTHSSTSSSCSSSSNIMEVSSSHASDHEETSGYAHF